MPPKKANSPILWVILIVVFLAAIAVAVYAYWSKNQNSNTNSVQNTNTVVNSNVNTTVNQNANSVANVNTAVSTTGWKTYENTTLSFRIKYPSNFVVFKEQLDGEEKYVRFVDKQYLNSEVSYPSVMVSVFQVKEATTLTKWVEDSLAVINYQTTIEDVITKQNLTVKEYQFGSIEKKVSTKKESRIYTISFAYYSEEKMQNEGNGFTDTFEIL